MENIEVCVALHLYFMFFLLLILCIFLDFSYCVQASSLKLNMILYQQEIYKLIQKKKLSFVRLYCNKKVKTKIYNKLLSTNFQFLYKAFFGTVY